MFVLFYNAGILYCPFAVVRFANCMLERDPRHMLPLLRQELVLCGGHVGFLVLLRLWQNSVQITLDAGF